MQRRKCIGVFIGQPNLPFQNELLKHIRDNAFAVDSNVVVFSSMIYTGGYPDFQQGESQNLALANFETMDAVIIIPDTLKSNKENAQEIIETVREKFHGPRVVLDIEVEGFQQFFCDDTDSVDAIVSHLIEQHNCTDIAFLTGVQEHPHSIGRLNGYYQALKKHNISIDESRVFYGDFWYGCGEGVVEALCKSEKGLPQAIACANDAMAVGVYKALEKRGYRIPEDVLITGFDHAGNAVGGDYPISSAMRNVGEIVTRAMRYIFTEWGITDLPKFENKERLVLNKSCGCIIEKKEVYQYEDPDSAGNFNSVHNFMLEDMISSDDIHACIWKIDWYASEPSGYLNDFKNMHICLCEDWNSLSALEHEGSFTDNVILALDKRDRYPGDEHNTNIKDIRFKSNVVFPRKEYFPGFGNIADEPSINYFNVLHFEKNCFGYIVLSYTPSCIVHTYDDVYVMWVREVNAALESLRRQYAVEELHQAAEARAITDIMTGLYNRNGYNKMLSEMINDIGEDEKFVFLFFDNNGLKYINDTYGHVAGDDVICQTARIISQRYFPEARKEINFRIGGDEYVKLVLGKVSGEMAGQCVDKIHEELNILNKEGGRAYPIYVAGGFQLYTADTVLSPDNIMKSADEQMYINKEIIKEKTGFRPQRKK